MEQQSLLDYRPRFSGATYSEPRDGERLRGQMAKVLALMEDGNWRTLAQIAAAVNGSEAGCSARLRDARKPRYGSRVVERRYVKNGLHEYRLVPK